MAEADLLSVEAALAAIVARFGPLPSERVTLRRAAGRVLAEEVSASAPLPAFDNAAMDGYAVRAADTAPATPTDPVRLMIATEIAAGRPAPDGYVLAPGTAARIMTGAVVPTGADAVVNFERTDERERGRGSVALFGPVAAGLHIRRAGEDIAAGSVVARRGVLLHGGVVAALAALGRSDVAVTRPPRVAIVATGDEVRAAGTLAAGEVYDSNSPMLAALAEAAGAEVIACGVAGDDASELTARLHAGVAAGADLLLTSGGVSRGDFDMVKDVLRAEGRIAFWQVQMRPGRPLAFGTFGPAQTPLLGLPGNPAAAFVTFLVFARPAIRTLLGAPQTAPVPVRLALPPGERITNRDGRRMFVQAVVAPEGDVLVARPITRRGALSGLATCTALLIIPEDRTSVCNGDTLTALLV